MSECLVVYDYKKRVYKEVQSVAQAVKWMGLFGYLVHDSSVRKSLKAPEENRVGLICGRFVIRYKGQEIGMIARKHFLRMQSKYQLPFIFFDANTQLLYKSDVSIQDIKRIISNKKMSMSYLLHNLKNGNQSLGNNLFVKYYHDPLSWVKEACFIG